MRKEKKKTEEWLTAEQSKLAASLGNVLKSLQELKSLEEMAPVPVWDLISNWRGEPLSVSEARETEQEREAIGVVKFWVVIDRDAPQISVLNVREEPLFAQLKL